MVKIYKKWQGEEIENSRALFSMWFGESWNYFIKKIESATYPVAQV